MKVEYIEFNPNSRFIAVQSPDQFKTYLRRFWFAELLKQTNLFEPGDFAQLPVQSSGVVGQGASL
jgi:hypothetical protein